MSGSSEERAPTPTLPRSAGEGARDDPAPVPSLVERGRVGEGARAELKDEIHRARAGLKGPRAAAWLEQLGCVVPALSNSWRAIHDQRDSIIARLGSTEFFLEESQPGGFVTQVVDALRPPIEGVYPVLREDRAFVLSGVDADDVLAQVCNVDFKRVSRSERHVVMTMMIGIAVLVIADEDPVSNGAREANGGCYRIWCDPSYGDYLWSSLQDVIRGA